MGMQAGVGDGSSAAIRRVVIGTERLEESQKNDSTHNQEEGKEQASLS